MPAYIRTIFYNIVVINVVLRVFYVITRFYTINIFIVVDFYNVCKNINTYL